MLGGHGESICWRVSIWDVLFGDIGNKYQVEYMTATPSIGRKAPCFEGTGREGLGEE